MYKVIPQPLQQPTFWASSTSSCSEMDENDSDLGFDTKEDDQFSFMDDVLINEMQMQSQVPPLAPCSETTASLSSAFSKRDKIMQQQHDLGLIVPRMAGAGTATIKTEILGCEEMLYAPNIPQMMHQHQNQMHNPQHQQMPQGFHMTSNNGQSSNNDGMDIYRDLILRHLVQDISTTCSKLYLPTNPFLWTVDHTNRWIIEMCQQFQLPTPICQFNVSGRALLEMSQEELMSRIPEGGDTIHAQLHLWSTAHDSHQNEKMESLQSHAGLVHHRQNSESINSGGWHSPTTPNKIADSYGNSEYYDQITEAANMNMYYGIQQNMHYSQQQMSQMHQQPAPQQQQQQMPVSGSPNSSFFMCNQQTLPSPSDSSISDSSSCLPEDDEFSDPASYLPMNYSQRPQPCQMNSESGYCMPAQNNLAQAHLAAGNGVQGTSFTRNTGTVHLWHFIRELLDQPKQYSSCVRWVDREEGTFKIESSHHLARFWGQRKNRSQMNYDKLSRSLRQYYKKGIIQKPEKKQRLVYKFLPPYNM